MKLLLSISITFSFMLLCSSNAFAKCTEEQISKMIVNNISQEQIDKTCSANSSGEAIAEVTKTELNNESGEVISISDWRSKEPNGLGFGLSSSGLAGINLFYDKNLDEFSQIHFQISSLAAETQSIFGITKLRVTEVLFLCSYRRFFSQEKGFYYGYGGGYGANTIALT